MNKVGAEPSQIVTAALLVIGDEILSGRTKDKNIGYIAEKDMNEARLRMCRIPAGAELIINKVSSAPGFRIGNVFVMAGVPAIMQAMLDDVAPSLQTSAKMLSESVRADLREGDIGSELGEIAKAHAGVTIGSYPFFDEKRGPNTTVVLRARDAQKLAAAKAAVEEMVTRTRAALAEQAR